VFQAVREQCQPRRPDMPTTDVLALTRELPTGATTCFA
jgi:hypothetical protein